jgi:hypothetical protein
MNIDLWEKARAFLQRTKALRKEILVGWDDAADKQLKSEVDRRISRDKKDSEAAIADKLRGLTIVAEAMRLLANDPPNFLFRPASQIELQLASIVFGSNASSMQGYYFFETFGYRCAMIMREEEKNIKGFVLDFSRVADPTSVDEASKSLRTAHETQLKKLEESEAQLRTE